MSRREVRGKKRYLAGFGGKGVKTSLVTSVCTASVRRYSESARFEIEISRVVVGIVT